MSSTVDSDEHVRLEIGVYVLGALAAPERVAVEEHLHRCPSCRQECDELAEVVALLSLLPVHDGRSRWVAPVAFFATTVLAASPLSTRLGTLAARAEQSPMAAVSGGPVQAAGPGQPLRLEYRDFSDLTGLVLEGDAKQMGTAIRLAERATQTGAVWSVHGLSPAYPVSAAFRVGPIADTGPISFVLQTRSVATDPPRRTSDRFVVVRLQPAATINGEATQTSVRVESAAEEGGLPVILAEGRPAVGEGESIAVWVDYSSTSSTLRVFVDVGASKPAAPVLSVNLDLAETLGEGPVFAGFSAAGYSAVPHDVLAWYLAGHS
jgi:hypothetical protein